MFRRSLDGLIREMARFVNAFAFICVFFLSAVVAVAEVGGRPLCKKCKKIPAATGHDDYCKRCYKEKHFFMAKTTPNQPKTMLQIWALKGVPYVIVTLSLRYPVDFQTLNVRVAVVASTSFFDPPFVSTGESAFWRKLSFVQTPPHAVDLQDRHVCCRCAVAS